MMTHKRTCHSRFQHGVQSSNTTGASEVTQQLLASNFYVQSHNSMLLGAMWQVVEEYGRDVLVDKSFLHVLCQRPRDAMASLQELARGHAVELQQGRQMMFVLQLVKVTVYQQLQHWLQAKKLCMSPVSRMVNTCCSLYTLHLFTCYSIVVVQHFC